MRGTRLSYKVLFAYSATVFPSENILYSMWNGTLDMYTEDNNVYLSVHWTNDRKQGLIYLKIELKTLGSLVMGTITNK
jgi:hypothetical protein